MTHPKTHRLGELQLKIMKVLWEREEATVSDVHQSLSPETPLAYTTLATMLRKMEARGLVGHRSEGRSFVYRALVETEAVSRGMANDLLDRLFEGSLTGLVNHLLTTREVSSSELAELERLIERRKSAS